MPDRVVWPYLFFGGRCEEALEFYKKVLGAEVDMLLYFKESPDPPPPGMLQAGFEEKVMHSCFRIGENTFMASDGCSEGSTFSGFSLSVAVPTEEEAREVFEALSEGGEVTMPLGKTFWSPLYGMLKDRFGMEWMVSVLTEAGG